MRTKALSCKQTVLQHQKQEARRRGAGRLALRGRGPAGLGSVSGKMDDNRAQLKGLNWLQTCGVVQAPTAQEWGRLRRIEQQREARDARGSRRRREAVPHDSAEAQARRVGMQASAARGALAPVGHRRHDMHHTVTYFRAVRP